MTKSERSEIAPYDLTQIPDEVLKSEWARRNSAKRKTIGTNGGRKPACGNCRRPDCKSCKRRGLSRA